MILLDLDGVLVDFVRGACAVHKVINPYTFGATDWHLDRCLGLSPKDFWTPLIDTTFWYGLEWTADGTRILELCESRDEVTLVTSPSGFGSAAMGKMSWVKKHLPRYVDKMLIGAPKYVCDGTLVDDNDANVEKHIACGRKAVLVPRPWNKLRGHDTYTHLEKELNV